MIKHNTPITLARRFGAMSYDALCVFGLLLAVTQIAMIAHHFQPFDGEWYFQLLILSVIVFYFAWFWSRYGQTIGMRAWSISIRTAEGKPIGFWQGCFRFFVVALGLFGGGPGLRWSDRFIGTQLVSTNALEHPERQGKKT